MKKMTFIFLVLSSLLVFAPAVMAEEESPWCEEPEAPENDCQKGDHYCCSEYTQMVFDQCYNNYVYYQIPEACTAFQQEYCFTWALNACGFDSGPTCHYLATLYCMQNNMELYSFCVYQMSNDAYYICMDEINGVYNACMY